ncbi:hypothetical protein EG830_00930 [bacterium]|nr:hypothetical protein [bacterium]
MLKILAVSFLLAISVLVSGQVEKNIVLSSAPHGARAAGISGEDKFLGNTPLNHLFSFHSEMSVLKVRLTACGYYDTVIKITPGDDSIRIVLERKKFVILPDSAGDSYDAAGQKLLSLLMKTYLDAFSVKNTGMPVNYMDFALLKKQGDRHVVSLTFEVEPEYLRLPKSADSDSIMTAKWEELFSSTIGILNGKQFSSLKNTDFLFSLMSGKKNLSIRHLPGIEQNDELRTQTVTYEGDYKRVTVTEWYYETVTSPTFNTTLDQSMKYSEILYLVSRDKSTGTYRRDGIGALTVSNNRVNVVYESSPGFCANSMLKKFLSTRK